MDLSKIKLGHSPLTDSIYIYRHGKDKSVALDKREAEKDVMAVVVQYMMHNTPRGATKKVRLGAQWYEIAVRPVEHQETQNDNTTE